VINGEVPIPTTHKRIIGLVFVRIDDAPTSDLFDGQLEKSLSLAVRDNLDKNLASSREDAEDRDLAGGATTTFAFASAAVEFYERSGPAFWGRIFVGFSSKILIGISWRQTRSEPTIRSF